VPCGQSIELAEQRQFGVESGAVFGERGVKVE
jgi:hypothetical protein